MAESARQKRMRELGLVGGGNTSEQPTSQEPTSTAMSSRQKRLIELGIKQAPQLPDLGPDAADNIFRQESQIRPSLQPDVDPQTDPGAGDSAVRYEQSHPGRDIPYVGTVLLRGMDAISENPYVDKAAEVMRSFYTPGAGMANVAGASASVGAGISKLLPNLGSTLGGRVAQTALREGIVGAPVGAGQSLAMGNNQMEDVAHGALYGAGFGGALGAAGPVVGKGLQALGQRVPESRVGRFINDFNKPEAPDVPTYGDTNLLSRADSNTNRSPQQGSRLDDAQGIADRVNRTEAYNSPESQSNRADSVLEQYKLTMQSKYDPQNMGEDVWNRMNRNEKKQMAEYRSKVEELPPTEQPVTNPNADMPSANVMEPPFRPRIASAPESGAPLVRGNYKNQLDNGNFSEDLQRGIRETDQTYERVPNRESVSTANENVKNLTAGESKFLLNESGGPEHIATGYRLMQELDALGEHSRALVVSKKLAEDLTKGGQTVQAAAILSRLSPEGQLLNLVRTAERNGKEVTVADSVKFKELAAKVQEKSGAGVRANQINEILNRMEKGDNVGVDDIKKLSNYLSGSEKVINPKPKVVYDLPKEFNDVRKRDRIVSYFDDVEQAALARIAARKNNLNSLPLPEWKDHSIVVASQIAKGTIKAATHVEDLVKMFGEEIRPVATQVYQNAQKLITGVSRGAAEGNLQKANEAFSRISGHSKDTTLQEKIVEKYLKENPKVSPKDIDSLRELAKNVTKLSGDQKLEADIAMQKILNSYEKSSTWDKLLAIRYMSMLLNTSTQAINAISGPIMATTGHTADVLGTMVDIVMSKALKQPRTTTLYGTNPLQFMARYFKNLKTGAKAGAMGVNPAGIQGTNEIRGLAFKSLYNPLGLGERVLGAVAKGPDFATYKSVFDSEMVKQGFLDAKNSGIKGKQNIQNHIEKFINDPPETAVLQADRIGKNTTFQRSDTTGGKMANFLNNSPSLVKPAVNAVFPFVRTPVNIASTAVTMTPAGILKGLYQLSSKSDASRREAIRTLSMGLTGTGISALGYYLSQIGVITGANDSGDKEVDAIREQAGKGKYRFNTSALMRYIDSMFKGDGDAAAVKAAQYLKGDEQFDYNKLQPLALAGAIGASLQENKDKPGLERIGKAGEDAFGSLFGMSTLKGVQDVFQPQYGGTVGEKALGVPSRLAESFFKSFSSGGIAQETRRQDPIVRKVPFNDGLAPDVKAYFQSRTPGLSQSLPPSKTTLGQNKMNAPGIKGQYLNPYKSEVAPYNDAAAIISSLIDKTGDLSLAPSAPDKKVEGYKVGSGTPGTRINVALTPERYAKLQEDVGQGIIKGVIAIDNKLSDAEKAKKIKEVYTKVKEAERNKVKKENGIRLPN